ncbi:MAG: hypothetical protein WC441_02150 [Patescibacteria group bacterium]
MDDYLKQNSFLVEDEGSDILFDDDLEIPVDIFINHLPNQGLRITQGFDLLENDDFSPV